MVLPSAGHFPWRPLGFPPALLGSGSGWITSIPSESTQTVPEGPRLPPSEQQFETHSGPNLWRASPGAGVKTQDAGCTPHSPDVPCPALSCLSVLAPHTPALHRAFARAELLHPKLQVRSRGSAGLWGSLGTRAPATGSQATRGAGTKHLRSLAPPLGGKSPTAGRAGTAPEEAALAEWVCWVLVRVDLISLERHEGSGVGRGNVRQWQKDSEEGRARGRVSSKCGSSPGAPRTQRSAGEGEGRAQGRAREVEAGGARPSEGCSPRTGAGEHSLEELRRQHTAEERRHGPTVWRKVKQSQ